MTPPAGTRLGHHELGALIARSPRALILAARDYRDGTPAVAKLFLQPDNADPTGLNILRERLESLRQLHHPAVPGIRETGEHDGRLFLIREWVDGIPVRLDGSQPPLPPSLAARTVERLARALHTAHQLGLVHPDLTRHPILLDGTDEIHVLGFDRADSPGDIDRSAIELGVLPPECARDADTAASVRSNVHSLGMLLHVLLTGSPPFRAATRAETLRLVLEHEVPSPESKNPLVPRELAALAQRCLAREPGRRPGTAAEVAAELARFLRSESSPASRRPWLQRVARFVSRHPGTTLAGILVAGGLAAATLVGLNEVQAWRSRHAALLLEQAAANRLVGRRAAALEQIARAAHLRPDAASRQAAIETLVVPELRPLARIPMNEACQVRFSADGSLVAIAGNPLASPVPAGRPAQTASEQDSESSSASFGVSPPDGSGALPPAGGTPQGGFPADPRPLVLVHDLSGDRSLGELPWAVDQGPAVFHPGEPWLVVPQPDGTALWTPRAAQPPVRLGARGVPLFSPDGRRLAIGSSNIVVYALSTLLEEGRLEHATLIAWADNDVLLVREGEEVMNWNLATGRCGPMAGPGQRLLAISPETGLAAWLIPDSPVGAASVSLRSLKDQAEFWRPEGLAPGAIGPPFLFRRAGTRAFVGDRLDPSLLRVLDVANRRHLGSLSLPGARFGTVPPLPENRIPAITPSLRQRMPTLDPASPDRDLASSITRSGRYLAVAIRNPDPVVEVQDLQEGRLLASLAAREGPVWSPDGHRLAVTRRDTRSGEAAPTRETVEVMSLRVPAPNLRLETPVPQIRFAPDGNRIDAGNRSIQVRYPDGPPELLDPDALRPGLVCGPDSAGGTWGVDQTLVAGTLPLELHSASGETRSLPKNGDLTRLVFAPDGERLLLAHGILRPESRDGSGATNHFELWNPRRGKLEAVWPATPGVASGGPAVYSPDGRHVASAFFQTAGLELIDPATGSRERLVLDGKEQDSSTGRLGRMLQTTRPPMPRHVVRVLQFAEDSRRLFAGTAAGWLCGVDCITGELLLARPVADGEITALAVQPKGVLIAISAKDGLMRLCRSRDGEEVARWRGPRTSFGTLEFGPQGRLLAAGSEDGLLQVWDLSTMREGLTRLGLNW
ncbi:MAG: protein kinase [Verrucomicrobiales bacterium]|nr:protein kinase [Verrucomicrobiales bacterium]